MKRKIAKGLTDAKERQNQSRGNGNERNSNRGLKFKSRSKTLYSYRPKSTSCLRLVYDLFTTRVRHSYNITNFGHGGFYPCYLHWSLFKLFLCDSAAPLHSNLQKKCRHSVSDSDHFPGINDSMQADLEIQPKSFRYKTSYPGQLSRTLCPSVAFESPTKISPPSDSDRFPSPGLSLDS